MLSKKRLIFILMCAVCLVSCSDTSVSEEISSFEEVSVTETVTTVTAVQTTQPASETSTVPIQTTENVNETADVEIPENAAYKQTKYYMNGAERKIMEISFFDEHDNVICIVNCNLNDNIFRTMRYVYKYNNDNTISSKKLIAENGITSTNKYEYNDDGTLKSIAYFSEGGDRVKTERYEYNEDGSIRLKNTFKPDDSEPCGTEIHEYEYGENGRIARDIITKTDNFSSSDYDGTETLDYTYDENGNLLTEHSVRTGVYHRLATDVNEDNMTVYAYNSENQRISAEITDKYGNVSIIEYEYYESEKSRYIGGIEIPENAEYKQTVTSNGSHGFFTRTVNIFNENDNMLISAVYTSENEEPPTSWTIYTYDTDSRLIKEDFYYYNNRLLHYIEYKYNGNGIMISDTEYDNLNNGEVHEIRTEYIYDDKGRLFAEHGYQNDHQSGKIEYEYDEQDRLIKDTFYGRINSYRSYSYDENGNLSEKTDNGEFGVTVTYYTYDENNRLIKAEDYHDGEWIYTYEYEYEEL